MITLEQKLAMEKKRSAILEEMIEQKTRSLYLANKKLSEQVATLQEISWTQSHQLREPLTKILGILNYLSDHDKFTDYQSMQPHLKEAALTLDKVIRSIIKKAEHNESH